MKLLINSIPVPMELDTGASVSLVSEQTWRRQLQKISLQNSDTTLGTYTGEGIKVLGQVMVKVESGNQVAKLPLLVVPGNGEWPLTIWKKLVEVNLPKLASD